MSETKRCPHCGEDLEPDPESQNHRVEPGESAKPVVGLASTTLMAPDSNDDAFLKAELDRHPAEAELDPILGEFAMSAVGETENLPVGNELSASFPARSSSRSSLFPVINLEPSTRNSAVRTMPPTIPSPEQVVETAAQQQGEAPDAEDDERGRGAWSAVLLASYASAVTLALGWFVIKDRNQDEIKPLPAAVKAEKTEQPRTAVLSTNFGIPEPIEGEHFAKLGQPIKVGSLEITPLDVKRQNVKLVKNSVLSVSETKDGGKNALILRLKLTNLANDTAFAPLDPLYLRARGDQLVDSYVTTASEERLYPFPLAIESDLSIVGQDFTELRPRESRVVSIVTAPDAPPDTEGPFTWRVRLRTGIKRTDLIGLVWPAPAEPKAETKPN